MRTKPHAAFASAAWLLAALCVVVAVLPSGTASALLSGAGFALAGPERCLAAIGLGLAAATGTRRRLAIAVACILLGALLALAARATPAWTILTDADVYRRLHLLGPVAAVLSGLVLVLPDRWRTATLPPATTLVAFALTLTAVFNDPDLEPGGFALGAALAFLSLPLILALVVRAVRRSWFAIPERIAGSWCLAIGLLLAGVQLIPSKPSAALIAEPPVPPATAFAPDADTMLRPDNGQPAAPFPGLGDRPSSY